jgi:hypothetical protein
MRKETHMRLLDAAAANLRLFGVLFALVVAFGLSLGLGLTATGVIASHNNPHAIHACVDTTTHAARFVQDPSQCQANEAPLEWLDAGGSVALEARIVALEDQVPDCLTTDGDDAVFEGCNVHVRNGEGDTLIDNGLGNLIVGYNEDIVGDVRTGSHNLVIGAGHTYTSNSSIVVGFNSAIDGWFSSVTAGGNHSASNGGSVTAGHGNIASGSGASVSGGIFNEATGDYSSVSGGQNNLASGDYSSVSGGQGNTSSGVFSSVSGGDSNEAIGFNASVSGGFNNVAFGNDSSVSGGRNNAANGNRSTVSGGDARTASGTEDWVAGALFEDF